MAQSPGKLTFEINRTLIGDGVSATDDEAARAVAFAFHELKLVVEPGGAVALGTLLAGIMGLPMPALIVVTLLFPAVTGWAAASLGDSARSLFATSRQPS